MKHCAGGKPGDKATTIAFKRPGAGISFNVRVATTAFAAIWKASVKEKVYAGTLSRTLLLK